MKRINDRGGERSIKETETQQQLIQELITEILLRLPVKSLVRFKSVCKSWLSLISDPHFATLHFHLPTAAHTHRIIFIPYYHTHETRSIDFEASLNDDSAIASLKLDFLLPQSYLNLKIGGSSRGFLFLYCPENIYLWNPSTGIHKQISWSPIVSSDTYITYLYGFGYDPSTDDYLVVLGSYDNDDLTHFEFFSVRANTWKEIEGARLPYIDATYEPKVGTLFNGAIHWFAQNNDIEDIVIVSFDLIERRISEMALPDVSESYDPSYSDLWVFGGFMSLWAVEDETIEIWVMEVHGVDSSWTKTVVLSIDEDSSFYPICSTNCGDIVGSAGNIGLVKYNDNGQLLELRGYSNNVSLVTFYTESLLSLPLPRDNQKA